MIKASYWMLVTLLSFSLMAVAVKELTVYLNTSEIIFFRSLVSLLIILPIVGYFGFKKIVSKNIGKHIARNISHFFGQFGWIYGIAFIPLAEVFALEFTVPIWTAIIATLLLKERVTKNRILAIVFGILGVVVILRPGIEIIHFSSIAVLLGALSYGLSHTLTKSLVKNDTPLSVIFYMTLIQLPIGLTFSLNSWVMPSGTMWFWIVTTGLSALIAHYCMAKAMTFADAMVVVPMDFLRLPIIMVVGLFFYNEDVEWLILIGALLMIYGNFINLKHENKVRS
ncbi:Membrane protein [hydrothermal vent metagenome]|uniref:Membrane protein n=1 Tax=hydrothermal vent metagenome TaxID=652676 RepID=A0A3B1A3W8_9ZZZZ